MSGTKEVDISLDNLATILQEDRAVKVAGIDIDGTLRGKLMAKEKFLSVAKDGFGFCSVIFGWDMHDQTYFKELKVSNKENGYRDLVAVPDLKSFRRIPWENDIPFFLVKFLDPDTLRPISPCPRSLLSETNKKIEKEGYKAMAGGKQLSFLLIPLHEIILT
jgi:glutamine synthetase